MSQPKIRFVYRSGFRRLWFVVSAIWIIITGYIALTAFSNPGIDLLAFVVGPPIALYFLGVAAAWVIEGFAKVDR